MSDNIQIRYTDNQAIAGRPDAYIDVLVDVSRILQSWRMSLFSHEWLLPDGRIKDLKELPASEQIKRQAVELAIANGKDITKPVLGIGLLENVEIGTGKAEFLTVAALGQTKIPVHIPKSNESDFKDFVTGVE